METVHVKYLIGPLDRADPGIWENTQRFFNEITQHMDVALKLADEQEPGWSVYYIATGGTAKAFRELYWRTLGPYVLIASPGYNSLAAAMEILSWLQERGERGGSCTAAVQKSHPACVF